MQYLVHLWLHNKPYVRQIRMALEHVDRCLHGALHRGHQDVLHVKRVDLTGICFRLGHSDWLMEFGVHATWVRHQSRKLR